MSEDRNVARNQPPWTYRRRVITGSLVTCATLFLVALLLDRNEAFAAIAGIVMVVVPVAIGGAVFDDHSRRATGGDAA